MITPGSMDCNIYTFCRNITMLYHSQEFPVLFSTWKSERHQEVEIWRSPFQVSDFSIALCYFPPLFVGQPAFWWPDLHRSHWLSMHICTFSSYTVMFAVKQWGFSWDLKTLLHYLYASGWIISLFKLFTSAAGDCPLYKVLVRAVSDLQYTAVFSQT